MKAKFKIENGIISTYSTEIMVSNYHALNEVFNQPIVDRESMLENRHEYLLGFWRVKQLKQSKN